MFKINTKFLIFTLLIIILLSGVVYAVEPVDCVGNSGSTNPLGVCKVDNTKGLAVSCYGTSCVTEKPASTGFLNIINPYSYINLDDIVNTDYYYQDYFFSPGSPSTQYDLSSNIFPIYGPGHLPFSSLADINLNLFDIEESAFDDLLVYYEDDELSNYKVLFVATMFAEEAYFKSYNLENNFSHISGENWFEIEDHNSDYNLYFGLNLVEKTCFPTTNPRAEYKLTRRNNFNYSLPAKFVCEDYTYFRIEQTSSCPFFAGSTDDNIYSGDWDTCVPYINSLTSPDLLGNYDLGLYDFIHTSCGDNHFQIDLGFADEGGVLGNYKRITKLEFAMQDYTGEIGMINFMLVCHNLILPDDDDEVCTELHSDDAWHLNPGVTNHCCEPVDEGFYEEGLVCHCQVEVCSWDAASSQQACEDAIFGLVTPPPEGTYVWEQSAWINNLQLETTGDGSDGCCGDDEPLSFTQTGLNDLYYVDTLSQYFCSVEEADTMNLISDDNLVVNGELIYSSSSGTFEGWQEYNNVIVNPGIFNSQSFVIIKKESLVGSYLYQNISVVSGESYELQGLAGNFYSNWNVSIYDGSTGNYIHGQIGSGFSTLGDIISFVFIPPSDTIEIRLYPDYGHRDTAYDSIIIIPELDLNNWNWLDAYSEEYVIHNAQLVGENVNVISNSDNWYVCNATGSANDVLGFDQENYTVDNFKVLPLEGDRIGNCPQGWYYCHCINESSMFSETPEGCVAPNLVPVLADYTHNDYPQCIISPYLCNSDYDYSTGIANTCGVDIDNYYLPTEEGYPVSCADGEELFGPFTEYGNDPINIYDQYNNNSCPATCEGFPFIDADTPFNPPIIGGGFDLILKSECSNANANSCFGSGSSGFFENTEELCIDGDDNDGDCCISGYVNGICAIGHDTNGDGDVCKEGDIGVDCLDADCINAGHCEPPPSDFEYQCNDSIDNDGDCCNDRDDDGGLNLPYYQPESLVECTSGFENTFDEVCRGGSFNTDCMDSDCLTSAQCVESYSGLSTFAAPKNHSVICYERSGESIFTECCDNFGLSCFNALYQDESLVDSVSEFVGRGVPLYALRTYDGIDAYTKTYVDYVGKASADNNIAFLSAANHKFEYISDTLFPYYKTLEFDFGFTNLDGVELVVFFELSNGSFDNVTINQSNFNEYSMNGNQSYRWHHIVINLDEDFVRFDDIVFDTGSANLLFDNVFFGVDPIDSTQLDEYQNYKCTGAFGFWIDEFDPDEVEAPLMSCQDVDHGDEGCTACDWVDADENTCNMSTLINTPSSTEWYDFDPFKYICDSYLSFGWSGTKCCGDDTTRTNKEFYWDYKGACWSGYNVIDNQRMGDVLYFNDEENELNKFLFYKNFSVCNEPQFDLNVAYANTNKIYVGLDPSQTYTIDYGNDQYQIHMYNNTVCDIKGNYYCGGGTNNLWRDDVLGVPDWIPTDFLFLKNNSYDNNTGCCPSDYCWNGEICVHATVYEDNSSMNAFDKSFSGPEHILFEDISNTKGYRCVFDEKGYAIWENATAKYDWNLNSTGYCKHADYCFVDETFEFLNTTRDMYYSDVGVNNDGCCDINSTTGVPFDTEYIEGENTTDCLFVENPDGTNTYYNVSDFACQGFYDCIPDKTTVNSDFDIDVFGNYYCDSGNWTTRTAKLASKMCEWFDCASNEFTLSCDNDLIFNMDFLNENNLLADSIHSACVYQKGDVVAVGFVLKANFLDSGFLDNSLFNNLHTGMSINCDCTWPNTCNYSGGSPEEYDFYYTNESNFLLVSTNDPDTSGSSNFLNGLVNFVYGIFHPTFNPDFFVLSGNTAYDKLFMAHNVGNTNLQVMAAQEHKYDETNEQVINRIFVNYSSNFDLSNHLNNTFAYGLFEKDTLLDQELVGDIIYNRCNDEGFLLIKEPQVNLLYEPESFDKQDLLWTYLTKTLRLNSEPSGGPVYTGDICSDCDSVNICNTGLQCDFTVNKCKINETSGIPCNFNEECYQNICINNQCDPLVIIL